MRPPLPSSRQPAARRALEASSLLALLALGCSDESVGRLERRPPDPALAAEGDEPPSCGEAPCPVEAAPSAGATAPAEGTRWDLCGVLAARAGVPLTPGERVSLADHLCELADLDRFTRAGRPYVAKMASSHDRKSQVEGADGWFANQDYGHFLRSEADEQVLMESRGPGVITRLWSANPESVLRIYVDDPEVPALEVDMQSFFRGAAGAPLAAPFVYESAGGLNALFPIPYASYARVAVVGAPTRLFYQVNYREYGPGTAVEPWSKETLAAVAPLAREVAAWLADPRPPEELPRLAERTVTFDESTREQRLELGPAVIRELTLSGFEPTDRWLRRTRIVISVDGERTVDAPVSTLFTADLGPGTHASVAATVTSGALTLRWPMPVPRAIAVRFESNGVPLGALEVRLRYTHGVPEDARLFHAQWTGARTFDTTSPVDWTLLHYRGEGVYVGTVLNVANPVAEWWGEGDEKVFVDGSPTPSMFGTGTEDYFGYGWCSNQPFATPWNGQPRVDASLNWGRASMYRFHTLDAVPFERELRFNLEVLHWLSGSAGTGLTEDALALWYARPGGELRSRGFELSELQQPVIATPRPFWLLPWDCRIFSLFN